MGQICKEKKLFCKTFHSMQNFLELQYLVDGLVNFLESLVFINDSLSSIYYLKKKTRDLDMKKKF